MEAKKERQVHGKRSVMLQNSDRVEDDPLGMRDLSVGEVEETSLEITREAGEESTAFVVSLLGPINFIFVIKIYSSDPIPDEDSMRLPYLFIWEWRRGHGPRLLLFSRSQSLWPGTNSTNERIITVTWTLEKEMVPSSATSTEGMCCEASPVNNN